MMVKLSYLGARYGMTPAAFERLLVEVGWLKYGELCGGAAVYVADGAVTAGVNSLTILTENEMPHWTSGKSANASTVCFQ